MILYIESIRKLVSRAEDELQKLDPRIGKLIAMQKPLFFEPRADYFFSLCRTIVGQQVSLPSAIAIFGRFEAATKLNPKAVALLSEEQTKAIGLSRQKTTYIKDTRSQRKSDEERHALKDKIVKDEHYLNHLYLFHLGEVIDLKINKVQKTKKAYRKGLELDTKEIAPVRNAVMHTVEITDDVMNWDKIKNVIDYIERLKEKIDKQQSQ